MTLVLLPRDGSLSAEELERRLTTVSERIVLPGGGTVAFRVRPLTEHFGDLVTAMLGTLGIAPGIPAVQVFFLPGLLVLAMACFNYVNLATAIASTRAKDVGLSKVLGAESRHVIAKYLLEAVVTVLVSLVLALALGAAGINLIRNLSGMQMFFADLATLDLRVDDRLVGGLAGDRLRGSHRGQRGREERQCASSHVRSFGARAAVKRERVDHLVVDLRQQRDRGGEVRDLLAS